MQTLKTNDYSIFKKCPANPRAIISMHLKHLIVSIETNNMLKYRPIMVNQNMEIMDGQHRLEAAKKLGIEIYYQINESAEDEDIILLNNNQKAWKIEDYVNFYINKGKVEYHNINSFLKDNKIGINFFIRNFFPSHDSQTTKIKHGQFKCPNPEALNVIQGILTRSEEIIKHIDFHLLRNHKAFLKTTNFKSAICQLILKGVDQDVFKNKIEMKMDSIGPRANRIGYFIMFKDIYNWKNKEPI